VRGKRYQSYVQQATPYSLGDVGAKGTKVTNSISCSVVVGHSLSVVVGIVGVVVVGAAIVAAIV
jgi:hypothetical protein